MKVQKIILLFCLLVFLGCAKRGRISGGQLDITPPVVVKVIPENNAVNFSGNQIEITFDEFVKIKDASKNIFVSPPLKKRLQIMPLAVTKKIKITFQEDLNPNTTYSINFSESIQDNNEDNILKDYTYVFSTGNYIDSLTVSGFISDAYQKEIGAETKILLYKVEQNYTDSIPYQQAPTYISRVGKEATTFQLNNIKEGTYKLLAITDKNGNNKYDPKQDKIGFVDTLVQLPTDENFHIKLFKEQLHFKPIRAFEDKKNKIVLAYEGNNNEAEIQLMANSKVLPTKQIKVIDKDSLALWYHSVETDSLIVQVKSNTQEKNFVIKPKNLKPDTLQLKFEPKSIIGFTENVKIVANTPIENIDKSKITILDKDSLNVPFEIQKKQDYSFELDFEKQEKYKYKIQVLPAAVIDYFGKTNDTIIMNTTTQSYSNYGNLKIKLENVRQYPIIVELVNQKGEVYQDFYTENQSEIDFMYINPAVYKLRIIYDTNKNKKWDTGNFLKNIQPEKVLYYPKDIDVRANWDINETFKIIADKN